MAGETKHSVGHWLVTVMTKAVTFVFFGVLGAYFLFSGLVLAAGVSWPLGQTEAIIAKTEMGPLPYSGLIEEAIMDSVGVLYARGPLWFGISLGVPLIITGAAMIILPLFSLYWAIFSRSYNLTHCPFCAGKYEVNNISDKNK